MYLGTQHNPNEYQANAGNLGNVLVIGVLVTGYVLYTRQQQGKPVIPNKKTN